MTKDEIIHYKELDIYCPEFNTIELCCTNIMIPCFHKDTTLSLAGPFTRNYGLIPSHDRVVGWYVSDGKAYLNSEFIPQIDTFVFCDGKYSFYYELSENELRKLLIDTAEKGGMAFQQQCWVFNGEISSLYLKNRDKKYHFRALSDYGGRLCVIESREKTQCERFKDLLVKLGARNAISLDTGLGWQNSWMRKSDGRCRILHFFPWPFGTNRIVFKKMVKHKILPNE